MFTRFLASSAVCLIMMCAFGVLQGQSSPQVQPAKTSEPKSDAADGFKFSDAPAFSIAGVTDWTAVGGHGSDATLRTSEDLNREALELTANKVRNAETLESPETEKRLQRAVAATPAEYASNHALGMYYLRVKHFRDALEPLSAASKVHPDSADDTYSLALAYRGAGDAAHARQLVQTGLRSSESADLRRLTGELDEAAGDPVKAVQEEERATRIEPSEENYFTWGSELLLHRAVWQAAQVFAEGAKTHPASARLQAAWGAALFSEAMYEEAAQKLCVAAELNRDDVRPYQFLGKAVIASPVPLPCAQAALEQYTRLHPTDAEANYYLAMTLLRQGNPPEPARAEALLRKAVTLNPKYAHACLQLGILASAHNDIPAAVAYFTNAINADPQLGEAHYRLGVIYDRTGDKSRARQEYALHEKADAAEAARVEQQRRDVKQFLITSGQPADGAAR